MKIKYRYIRERCSFRHRLVWKEVPTEIYVVPETRLSYVVPETRLSYGRTLQVVGVYTKENTTRRVIDGLMVVISIVHAKMVKLASTDAETGKVF